MTPVSFIRLLESPQPIPVEIQQIIRELRSRRLGIDMSGEGTILLDFGGGSPDDEYIFINVYPSVKWMRAVKAHAEDTLANTECLEEADFFEEMMQKHQFGLGSSGGGNFDYSKTIDGLCYIFGFWGNPWHISGCDMQSIWKVLRLTLTEAEWWHGTPSGDLRGGTTGLHIGTKLAATQALEAKIGIPADGKGWEGTREYGKTLLAGRDRIESDQFGEYRVTGYNARAPRNDYYPSEHPEGFPKYSNGERVAADSKPWVRPVQLTGKMSNQPHSPLGDWRANGIMRGLLRRGKARRGYFYKNDSEDYGSISAVVPNGSHIRISEDRQPRLKYVATRIDGVPYGTTSDETHFDIVRDYIIRNYLAPFQREDEDRYDIAMGWLNDHWDEFHNKHETEDGFIDTEGRFHSREDAAKLLTPAGLANMKREDRFWVDSTDLDAERSHPIT